MRAALNLHTAPFSISANSRTPIRASRNIPGFPFSLCDGYRKKQQQQTFGPHRWFSLYSYVLYGKLCGESSIRWDL
jgi:hypothetical protein